MQRVRRTKRSWKDLFREWAIAWRREKLKANDTTARKFRAEASPKVARTNRKLHKANR